MISFGSRYASDFHETAELESQARNNVGRDIARPRRYPENEDATIISTVGALLQRVAGTSIEEIEVIIVELQALRLRLTTDAARVQREIVEYATLNQAAIDSTRIIAENISCLHRREMISCQAGAIHT